MIELKNISKDYVTGDLTVHALKNVSVSFRQNEFVAILGPSGGGKTTLLNIIGGLDHCTSGDLIINGKSTAKFNSRDWDSYRNHSVGFIFQSYNLIPHQNILANVELALTISGISKKERTERAKKALEDVGLGEYIKKKPNQLSGGQMQRVAIARALVNDPDIVLADEPTGALDTQSSIQIMDLLKEVAKDRLVVMVTHNPDLAEEYANRIIRIKDGELTSDSNPYNVVEKVENSLASIGKAAMGLGTAFMLSLNNLWSKKARTLLVSFAGSIGIIGIALIMSLSNGVNQYIDDIQKESLSSYPLVIQNSGVDMTSAMTSMLSTVVSDEDVEEGYFKEQTMVSTMFDQVDANNLSTFKQYLEENYDEIEDYVTTVVYDYGITPQIYSSDTSDGVTQINPSSLSTAMTSSLMSSSSSYSSVFQELIDDQEMLDEQYDILMGEWPDSYDELVLIVNDESFISDYLIYSLGLRDMDELVDYMTKAMNGEVASLDNEPQTYSYEELMNLTYKLVLAADYYEYDETYGVWNDMSGDEEYMTELVNNGVELKIVGIVIAKDGVASTVMSTGVGYTSDLIDYIIEESSTREIVIQQLENTTTDVFSGREFGESEDKDTSLDLDNMISIDEDAFNSAFNVNISSSSISNTLNNYINEAMNQVVTDVNDATQLFNDFVSTIFTEIINDYVEEYGYDGMATIDTDAIATIIENEFAKESTQSQMAELEEALGVSSGYLENILTPMLSDMIQSYADIAEEYLGTEAAITQENIVEMVTAILSNDSFQTTMENIITDLLEARVEDSISSVMSEMSTYLASVLGNAISIDTDALSNAFQFNITEEELTNYMMTMVNYSSTESTLSSNLATLGYADYDSPESISFYIIDYESKDLLKEWIDDYNEMVDVEDQITYTDITGILMSSLSDIINAISYILIAFVSISLIVSSIMVAIITYISVLERTKEIGVLRSLGASKFNVANIFNAETFITGLTSGTLGVLITMLLCFPINSVIRNLTGVSTLTAYLPWSSAGILILISVVLNVIAGLIPSSMASNTDPVTALRTE